MSYNLRIFYFCCEYTKMSRGDNSWGLVPKGDYSSSMPRPETLVRQCSRNDVATAVESLVVLHLCCRVAGGDNRDLTVVLTRYVKWPHALLFSHLWGGRIWVKLPYCSWLQLSLSVAMSQFCTRHSSSRSGRCKAISCHWAIIQMSIKWQDTQTRYIDICCFSSLSVNH